MKSGCCFICLIVLLYIICFGFWIVSTSVKWTWFLYKFIWWKVDKRKRYKVTWRFKKESQLHKKKKKKSTILFDLNAVYKSLGLDLQKYELSIKFFFALNVSNMSTRPCTTYINVAIFINKHITKLTHIHLSTVSYASPNLWTILD